MYASRSPQPPPPPSGPTCPFPPANVPRLKPKPCPAREGTVCTPLMRGTRIPRWGPLFRPASLRALSKKTAPETGEILPPTLGDTGRQDHTHQHACRRVLSAQKRAEARGTAGGMKGLTQTTRTHVAAELCAGVFS